MMGYYGYHSDAYTQLKGLRQRPLSEVRWCPESNVPVDRCVGCQEVSDGSS